MTEEALILPEDLSPGERVFNLVADSLDRVAPQQRELLLAKLVLLLARDRTPAEVADIVALAERDLI